MAHVWTIEAERLVAVDRADAEADEPSSRIELMGFDDAERAFADRPLLEVLAQAEHAAVPFVEQVGKSAAGIPGRSGKREISQSIIRREA